MVTLSVQANDFTLHGDHTTIAFATTSVSGKATFDYKAGHTHLQFTGNDIRSVDTEFAHLVTVTIGGEGDGGVSTITVFVPITTVPSATDTAQIETIAILTEQRRLGPAHQHYRVLHLHGTARQTIF
jgi:hypothetical protein